MREARSFFRNKSESKKSYAFKNGDMVTRTKKGGFKIYNEKLGEWIKVADIGRVISRFRSQNGVTGLLGNFYKVKFVDGMGKTHVGEFLETDFD